MIDFKKKLGLESIEKKINPVEIYDELDRRSETGPLRPAQKDVLTQWWSKRKDDKDLVLKLHTGQGKTLIGLLILQSKLNQKKGPCLYICPNKYLVKQTCQEAEKFGIGYVTIDNSNSNSLPDQFLNSEKILITHVQKVFNGKSIFGIGGKFTEVNTIILDDSHACIDSINEAFKIRVDNSHDLYKELLRLFKDDLREQGEGSFIEIESGESTTFLPVPYWNWQDKKSEVVKKLLTHKDDKKVVFTWDLIKDTIDNCQCFLSGKELEISTYFSPINQFATFSRAEHRILMSATTQNDSFFLKGLGLNIQSIINPLTPEQEKWSGEKMILIPSLIHENLDRNFVIDKISKTNPSRKVGLVAITSSFNKAKVYENQGSIVAKSENIFEEVSKLKQGNYSNTLVVVNRYDGIDLPDDSCRLLIIDSMPYLESLTERYEQECRSNSDLTNIRVAQKIEQGLGRSVRGEKDYSVILIIGDDLVKFLKTSTSNKFFSSQTRKQINIGLEISKMASEDLRSDNDYEKVIWELINQCLKRDDGWKEFYKENMDRKINESPSFTNKILEILELERKAEESFYSNEPEKAVEYVQKIIDSYCTEDQAEKGWYLQILARFKYNFSHLESIKAQQSAFKNNPQLLKPREGFNYTKLNYNINENRIKRIKAWINHNANYDELLMEVNNILENLSFGQPSEKFEKALQDLGNAIGFLSQRPDKEFKKGSDNLWCVWNNEYFMFECKNEVEDSRSEITKTETGQMNNHCAWFEQEYTTAKVKRILIIPTKKISQQGAFTHEVEIMRREKLNSLKRYVKSFFKEFKDYSLTDISDSKMQEFLDCHKLDIQSLRTQYSDKPYQKKI